MTIEDVRTKSDDELLTELAQQKKALYNLRFRKAGGQLEKTSEMRDTRRNVARILTVSQERKLGLERTAAQTSAAKAAKTAKPTKKAAATKAKK